MTTEAQTRANQANAKRSTGPTTPQGKEASRANSLNPGTISPAVPLSEGDSIELGHRIREYEAELIPTNAIEYLLVERMAVSSIRMDRGVSHEAASLALLIRKAEDDFVAPEGTPVQKLAKLRAEASARALFDPSKRSDPRSQVRSRRGT